MANVRFAMLSSPTTTTLCQTTGNPKEWEERGETTIRIISKQRIGGATTKRDQPEWTADGRRPISRTFPNFGFARNPGATRQLRLPRENDCVPQSDLNEAALRQTLSRVAGRRSR